MKAVFVLLIFLACALIILWLRRHRRLREAFFYEIREDDKEMMQAANQAKLTLPAFAKALYSPADMQAGFSIKARFRDGEKIEHIWLENVICRELSVSGELGNDSYLVNAGPAGTKVTVPVDDVTDWMYKDNGTLKGGYTIKLNYQRQPEWIRKRMKRGLPFQLE